MRNSVTTSTKTSNSEHEYDGLVQDSLLVKHRKKVALFGGSFDPATTAHFLMAVQLAQCGIVDEVWVVPCGNRPDKNMHNDSITRYWMTKLTLADCLGVPVVEEVLHAVTCAIRRTECHGVSSPDSFLTTGCIDSKVSPNGTSLGGNVRHGDKAHRITRNSSVGLLSTHSSISSSCVSTGNCRDDTAAVEDLSYDLSDKYDCASEGVLSVFERRFAERCNVMGLRLLDIEVRNGDFIPTFKLDKRLRSEHPDCDIWIVVGEDLLRSLSTWVEGHQLMSKCRFIVVPRQLTGVGCSVSSPTAHKYKVVSNHQVNDGNYRTSVDATAGAVPVQNVFMDLSEFNEAIGLDEFCVSRGFAFVASSLSSTVARQRLFTAASQQPLCKNTVCGSDGAEREVSKKYTDAAIGLVSTSTLRLIALQELYTKCPSGAK
eukprot:Lankesteria_metandrocarpae@DN4503_c0_g1_i4.p2